MDSRYVDFRGRHAATSCLALQGSPAAGHRSEGLLSWSQASNLALARKGAARSAERMAHCSELSSSRVHYLVGHLFIFLLRPLAGPLFSLHLINIDYF